MKRYLLLTFCVFLAVTFGLQAQDHKLEFVVPAGQTQLQFKAKTKDGANLSVYKDGKAVATIEGLSAETAKRVTITFAAPANDTTIVVDGSVILSLEDEWSFGPVGLGTTDLPEIKSLRFSRTPLYKTTNEGVLDLSTATKLEEVVVGDIQGIKLAKEAPLQTVEIKPGWNSTTKRVLRQSTLDLRYPTLKRVVIISHFDTKTGTSDLKCVDLTGATQLEYLSLQNNNLISFKGAQDLKKLTYCALAGNQLSMSDLVIPTPELIQAGYKYQQRGFVVPEEKISGPKIDINYIKEFTGADGTLHPTTFQFYNGPGTYYDAYEENKDYTIANGIVTFDQALFKDAEGNAKNIIVHIIPENPLFPDMSTSSFLKYLSAEISLGAVASYVLTYAAEGEGKLVVTVDNNVVDTNSKIQEGKQVVVKAEPRNSNFELAKWVVNGTDEAVTNNETTRTFTMDKALDIKAVFKEVVRFAVTFKATEEGGTLAAELNGVAINSGDMVREGSVVRFTATPKEPAFVLGAFVVNGVEEKYAAPYTTKTKDVMISQATEVKAVFASTEGVANVDAAQLTIRIANDMLQIEGLREATEVVVFNMSGAVVKSAYTEGQLSVADLANGAYIVKVQGEAYKVVK